MRRVMVRYKVKADRVEENKRLIADVFTQLKREKPAGLRYASFNLGDGVSFVHVVSFETPRGENTLGPLPAFKAFQAQLADRCQEQPVAMELTEVGSYRFFDD